MEMEWTNSLRYSTAAKIRIIAKRKNKQKKKRGRRETGGEEAKLRKLCCAFAREERTDEKRLYCKAFLKAFRSITLDI